MKKFFLMFVLLFLCVIKINAADVKSFSCDYTIKDPLHPENNFGKLQVQINNYNNGGTDYTTAVFYEDSNGKLVEYTRGGILDYKNNNNYIFLNILNNKGKNNMKNYVESYKNTGKCPRLYNSYQSEMYSIDYYAINIETNSYMDAEKMLLKGPNDSSWLSESEFNNKYNKSTTTETTNKDLNCSYTIKFDSLNKTSNVIFQRGTNSNNGSTYYSMSIDGVKEEFTTLDNDILVSVSSIFTGMISVSNSELKKILGGDKCIASNSIYSYLEAANADVNKYVITTSESEASENGIANRYNNGDGADNYDIEISKNPTVEVDTSPKTCNEILGNNLTNIVKFAIILLRVAGAVIAIINAMIVLVPAVMSKDADALQKSKSKCISMGILLAVILVFPSILRFIGDVLGFDISCLV